MLSSLYLFTLFTWLCLNTNVDFFFSHSPFFLNECNCHTSSIVHFYCLAISCVCQICGPFCQCYLMIVHVCLYCLQCLIFFFFQKSFLYTVPFECVHSDLAVCTGMLFVQPEAQKLTNKQSCWKISLGQQVLEIYYDSLVWHSPVRFSIRIYYKRYVSSYCRNVRCYWAPPHPWPQCLRQSVFYLIFISYW